MEKWNQLGRAGKLAAVGGVLVLVGSLLPWYSWRGFGISGWGSGILAILGILGVLAGAMFLLSEPLLGNRLTLGSMEPSQSALVVSAAGEALILLRLLTWVSVIGIGLILSAVGGALVAYGSFQAVKEADVPIPLIGRREQS
jgi:hypothetical protein